jgi:hypothetical protein
MMSLDNSFLKGKKKKRKKEKGREMGKDMRLLAVATEHQMADFPMKSVSYPGKLRHPLQPSAETRTGVSPVN